MGKYFGTDGFRGEAGITLTADHAYKVGRFLGWYYNALRERNGNNEPARIVIGKDTRRSSYMFEYSLVAGLTASGADAYLLHVTTTPSVAYIARVDDFDCGIMISASHNPYYDNGIKLIDCYGEKMPEETLLLVEDYIDGKLHVFDKDWPELPFAHREHIGRTVDYVAGRNRYMGYLISLGIYSFKGVKVGLVSPAMFADEAALVPGMLLSLPYPVFATSSIDAMVHAVESYLSPNACALSELFSEKALHLILSCWKDAVAAGGKDAWKKHALEFLRASNYAGIAFGHAGCAAVHAMAYPLGGVHHIPHGQANQLMFADVMRKYQEKKPIGKLNQLEELLGAELDVEPVFSLENLYKLMDEVLGKDPLHEHGVTADELPVFAKNVIETQQRLLGNNYVELSEDDLLDIYRKAF